jgi:lipopolysaccharide export system protein LptC
MSIRPSPPATPPATPPGTGRAAARPRPGTARLIGSRVRPPPALAGVARRRWAVTASKLVLPLIALALLSALALYPEFASDRRHGRLAMQDATVTPEGGELTGVRYQGLDDKGQPYTLTAVSARQSGTDRTDLVTPKADITLESGAWLMVQAEHGVYMQHAGQLDLAGQVTLYRDDGTTIATDAASVDLHAGAAAGADMVHVEGPFGTLDAQGFTVTDRGSVLQFAGPAHAVLAGGGR